MLKLIYAPKALDDLQAVKVYVARQFGGDKAKACVKEIISTVRQLEMFPEEGSRLEDIIEYPTDYHYLIIKPNYIFYRVEGDIVRIIRILNERQDFLQILFGINSASEDGEEFWGRMEN